MLKKKVKEQSLDYESGPNWGIVMKNKMMILMALFKW